MSGKIKLKARKSRSVDKRYSYYPEAYLIITDESFNRTVKFSPRYESKGRNDSIEEMLFAFRKHELKVDKTRSRKNYTSKLLTLLKNIEGKLKQMKLHEFDEIEDIYTKQIMRSDIDERD